MPTGFQEEWSMEPCDLCKEQAKKQRNTEPHKFLKKVGEERAIRGVPTGGYEEQDYVCTVCGSKFTYSSDRYDYGWILQHRKE